jgi:hypothetical protein
MAAQQRPRGKHRGIALASISPSATAGVKETPDLRYVHFNKRAIDRSLPDA